MISIIQSIHDFNARAGLLDRPYDDFLESSFQVEEALEGFNTAMLADSLKCENTPKTIARNIITSANPEKETLADVDRLDKACDAVIFAIGSMAKLGLTPIQIEQALDIVMLANNEKLGRPKDYYGKLGKPTNFVGPEGQLQQLLDER